MNNTAKQFIRRSNVRGSLALLRNWAVMIAVTAFSVWADSTIVYLFTVWIIGAFQYATGETLTHEASHYNLFSNKKLNDFMDIFYALPFVATVKEYRRQHLGHHVHLGKRHLDHVVDDYHLFGLYDKKLNPVWMWFGRPLAGYAGYIYLKMLFATSDREETKFEIKDMKLIGFWVVAIGLFAYFGALSILFWYWIVPLFWCFCSFLYWNELTEHFATNSGTRSNMGLLYNWIFHNQGYHALHHAHPAIPWYILPEACQTLQQQNPLIIGETSAGFFDTYRQIRVALA